MKFYLSKTQQDCIDNIKKTFCNVVDTIRVYNKVPVPYKYYAHALIPNTISLYLIDNIPDCIKFCDIYLGWFSLIKTKEHIVEYNINSHDYNKQKLINYLRNHKRVIINLSHSNDGITDGWSVYIQSNDIFGDHSTKIDITNYDNW